MIASKYRGCMFDAVARMKAQLMVNEKIEVAAHLQLMAVSWLPNKVKIIWRSPCDKAE